MTRTMTTAELLYGNDKIEQLVRKYAPERPHEFRHDLLLFSCEERERALRELDAKFGASTEGERQ